MESITKNRQSPETLRAMVAQAYGPDATVESVEEMGHGWFNVVYLIGLDDGRRVVLKIAPPPGVEVLTHERGAMATELAALRLISRNSTVPVPEVHHADTGHQLIDADWFFMSYVDADNFGILREQGKLTPEQHTAYNEKLGAVNRRLNEIRGDRFGALEGPGEATWRACFTRKIGDVLHDGERRSIDLGFGYDLLRAAIEARAGALDEVTEPRYVELDLWDSNAMVKDGEVVSIIDHERAFFGDPLIEAGFTGLDMPEYGDPSAFVKGYGLGELTPAQRDRRWLYSLYLVLVMIIETDYRGHTDTMQYDWCRLRLVDLMARSAGIA